MLSISEKYQSALKNYSFIDLFAGIGGFHYALSSYGARGVFASEIDKHAAYTYYQNHGVKPEGDITQIDEKGIPPHDILCAGFPCQAFSISGKQRGFEDTRGTLFFDIIRIVREHEPKIVLLENVKNLIRHDGGNTLAVIKDSLKLLGYEVYYDILNASHYGLPQNRERIYFIAFRKDLEVPAFQFPKSQGKHVALHQVLEDNPEEAKVIKRDDISIYKSLLFSEDTFFNKPVQIGKVNKGGQGERIYHPSGHAITLSAHGGGVGAKTGLYLIGGKIRKLSPRECARLQGFPETFKINPSPSQAYKQFGNAVAINVLQSIISEVVKLLENHGQSTTTRLANS